VPLVLRRANCSVDRLGRSSSDSEALGNRLLGLNADDAIDELAVLEDEQGRYACDLKTRRCLRILINIQFSYSITPLRLRSELI